MSLMLSGWGGCIAITEKFKGLFKEFDCVVVDHVIVSGKSAYSMVERGDFRGGRRINTEKCFDDNRLERNAG